MTAILPLGRRRETLFFNPFDSDAARAYAYIAAARRSTGHLVASADCQIAAIAAAARMRPATRNVRDFEDMGVEIVNPWAGV